MLTLRIKLEIIFGSIFCPIFTINKIKSKIVLKVMCFLDLTDFEVFFTRVVILDSTCLGEQFNNLIVCIVELFSIYSTKLFGAKNKLFPYYSPNFLFNQFGQH